MSIDIASNASHSAPDSYILHLVEQVVCLLFTITTPALCGFLFFCEARHGNQSNAALLLTHPIS
jgi:hypothetical protein